MRAGVILLAALWLVATGHQGHMVAAETHAASAGHLFRLRCGDAAAHTNVSWSRGGSVLRNLPPGAEQRGAELWFLPAEQNHSGMYHCRNHNREPRGSWERSFRLVVSAGPCPEPVETRTVFQGHSCRLPCKLDQVLGLSGSLQVQWLKQCAELDLHGQGALRVDQRGGLWLHHTSEADAGVYTCLLQLHLDGHNHSATRSLTLEVTHEDPVEVEPLVVFPVEDWAEVQLGSRAELSCRALMGFSENQENLVYWTLNQEHSDKYQQLQHSLTYEPQDGRVYARSTLTISKVLPDFLDVPLRCHLVTPAGQGTCLRWLHQADHTLLYTLAVAPPTLLLVAVAVFSFRKDLVLLYRKLLQPPDPDGKLYDAYVSCLHGDAGRSSGMESFVLQVLPEVLEKQHGYHLYIPGRDDGPGEATHDAVAAELLRSRRLILVLPQSETVTESKMEESPPLHLSSTLLGYEQRIGLHDALTHTGLRVILVDVDEPAGGRRLPESVLYILKRQGALKWRRTTPRANKSFWKSLRYHMPPVGGGKRRRPRPSHNDIIHTVK